MMKWTFEYHLNVISTTKMYDIVSDGFNVVNVFRGF